MGKKHKRNTSNIPRAISHPTAETTQQTQPTSPSAGKSGFHFISAKELLASYTSNDDRLGSASQASRIPAQPIMPTSASLAQAEEIPDYIIQSLPERLSSPTNRTFPVIDGILPEGITLLAGKAGSGLSHFALDLGISVASGQALLGTLPTKQGSVLFISEHDRVATLIQSYHQDHDLPQNLDIIELDSFLQEEGRNNPKEVFKHIEDAINDWRDENDDACLVIIDHLDAFCNNRLAGLNTYAIARRLSLLSFEISLLLLHQVRRTRTPDAIDAFSRLSCYTDYVQSFLLLHQHSSQHGYKTAHLRVVDPSLAEQTIPICFDPREGHWRLSMPETDAPPLSPERDAILRALHEADHPLSPSELAHLLNKDNGAIRTLLHSMSQDGQVFSPKRGLYLPLHPTNPDRSIVSPPNNIGVETDDTTQTVSPPNNIALAADESIQNNQSGDPIDFFSVSITQEEDLKPTLPDFLTFAQTCPIS